MPPRAAIDGPRENDDKDWWRELVDLVLNDVAPSLNELDRDNFFEIAYEHFAEAGVWELYPGSRRSSREIAAAISARRRFQFRRTLAHDSRAPRHLEIFQARFCFKRNRRGQTRSGNFSARAEICSISNRIKSCTSATIRSAIGKRPAPRDCRSFNWIRQKNSLRDLLSIL